MTRFVVSFAFVAWVALMAWGQWWLLKWAERRGYQQGCTDGVKSAMKALGFTNVSEVDGKLTFGKVVLMKDEDSLASEDDAHDETVN